jgi:hypothetical protein
MKGITVRVRIRAFLGEILSVCQGLFSASS